MRSYLLYATVEEPNQVLLTDLPLEPGQRVEIVVRTVEPESELVSKLQALFRKTQALPQAQTISEADIEAEIAIYRAELQK
jgi:hypothetical protein